jgi:hypothetical protein
MGYIRYMYQTRVNYLPNLHHRTIYSVASITLETLRNTWTEREYQLDVCCAASGVHVEVYWSYKIFGEFVHFFPKQLACIFIGVKLFSLLIGCGISFCNWEE